MSETSPAVPPPAPRWRWVALWAVGTLAFVVSNAHTGSSSRWYDDQGLIRTLGMWPLGAQGIVSSLLCQFTLAIPLATRIYRAGLVANIGAVACALLFFQVLHLALSQNARTPKLAYLFAFLGSSLLVLSGPMQRAATCAGGASIAVALALWAILVDSRAVSARGYGPASRAPTLLGLIIVAALAERFWAGAAAIIVILGRRLLSKMWLSPVESRRIGIGVLCACIAVSAPLLRMQLPHRLLPELPSLTASLAETWSGMAHITLGGVRFWRDAGLLVTAATVAGILWGLWLRVLRPVSFGWLLVLAISSAFGAAEPLVADSPVESLRVMAFASCALFTTITAQTLALGLLKVRVAYVGASVIVVVTLYAMLVAVQADDADFAAESRSYRALDAFTEEALWALPRGSVLLIRSRELAYRAWASRLADGMRPDVLVLTADRMQRNPDSRRLLAIEPALASLVRDMVIRGQPTEYSLSQLADARPLFVELEPKWDQRLLEHLSARGLWSEFHSQSLGRSDRYSMMTSTRAGVDRVIDQCNASVPPDRATLRFVAMRLKEQAKVFAAFGDRAGLYPLIEQLAHIGTETDFVSRARRAVESTPHGPIDLPLLVGEPTGAKP